MPQLSAMAIRIDDFPLNTNQFLRLNFQIKPNDSARTQQFAKKWRCEANMLDERKGEGRGDGDESKMCRKQVNAY